MNNPPKYIGIFTVLDSYKPGDVVITKNHFCYLILSINNIGNDDISYKAKSIVSGFLTNLVDNVSLSEIVAKIGEYHE